MGTNTSKKSNSGTLDTKRMFEHACAFYDCAKFCETEPNNIEYRLLSHTVSGIVNSAFSCEIFIKTLLINSGLGKSEIVGHKLFRLWKKFRKVDKSTAIQIETDIKNIFGSNDKKCFEKLLRSSSNAYDCWRYIYERNVANVNINFLIHFRQILRNTCCLKLFNLTWELYKSQDLRNKQKSI